MLMSKRVQVSFPDADFVRMQSVASYENLSLGEWVRKELSRAAAAPPRRSVAEKLAAIRRASEYSFPTGDIDQMNREIAEGYGVGLP
jgi:hypothetical protein